MQKSTFDSKFYIKAYNLNPKFTNPQYHYEHIGKKDNKLPNAIKFKELYPLFNISVYRQSNKDLEVLSDEQLMAHFHHFGRFECRRYR